MAAATLNAKTLVVYYSYTNNTRTIVSDLRTQLPDADVVEIQPAEEGLDYAADNYAIGSALMTAIRNNPDDAASYPAIKEVSVDMDLYNEVIVATPLWWRNMAAPMQTFLFHNGTAMADKRIGLIVPSASSGISGVEEDAKRLVPAGVFYSSSLWIRSSQTSNCHSMIADWINTNGIGIGTAIGNTEAGTARVRLQGTILVAEGEFESLRVLDSTGKAVLSSIERTTDISRLPHGLYVVSVTTGRNTVSHKIVW